MILRDGHRDDAKVVHDKNQRLLKEQISLATTFKLSKIRLEGKNKQLTAQLETKTNALILAEAQLKTLIAERSKLIERITKLKNRRGKVD